MSVLIKDMEMPESCCNCALRVYHSYGEYVCAATPLFYPWNLANYTDGRKDFCPLVEVDLIAQEELITPLNMIGGYLEKVGGSENENNNV